MGSLASPGVGAGGVCPRVEAAPWIKGDGFAFRLEVPGQRVVLGVLAVCSFIDTSGANLDSAS